MRFWLRFENLRIFRRAFFLRYEQQDDNDDQSGPGDVEEDVAEKRHAGRNECLDGLAGYRQYDSRPDRPRRALFGGARDGRIQEERAPRE